MITALDTNILLDLLIPDSAFGDAAQHQLDAAQHGGGLIVGEVVFAELAVQFHDPDGLTDFLSDTRIRYVPSSPNALHEAAMAWKRYTERKNRVFRCPKCSARFESPCPSCGEQVAGRQHILSDFMVGGHASVHAHRLLTRDLGYYRSYFPSLTLQSP